MLPAVQDFDTLQRMALALFKSGYFKDVESQAQAIVKVMAGHELGIPPFASMSGIDIIEGKPTLSANLIASLVDNSPRYDFRVITPEGKDREMCVIEWFRDGVSVGKSSFTMDEARSITQYNRKKNAWTSLAEKFNWKNYPSDMCFARALTRGQKRYAPGLTSGAAVYTPDELNVVEGEIAQENPVLNSNLNSVLKSEKEFENEIESENESENESEKLDLPTEANLVNDETVTVDVLVDNDTGEILEDQSDNEFPEIDIPDSPEPEKHVLFENKVAETRAWLEEKGQVSLGIIADAAVMTMLYGDREHVRNTLEKGNQYDENHNPVEPDMHRLYKMGLWQDSVDFRRTVKNTLMVFDALMKRKGY